MRFFLFLLPAVATAFAPVPTMNRAMGVRMQPLTNKVTDVADDILDRTEDIIEKVDNAVMTRGMRFIDHAPALVTLFHFAKKAGSSRLGVDAAPAAFAGSVATPALMAFPQWIFYIWPLVSIAQVASIAKSVLAEDRNELSQSDISALAAANLCAGKALSSATPLRYMLLTSIISGLPLRSTSANDVNIHNAAFQLMSSFTAVATIMAACAGLPSLVPFFDGKAEVTASLAVAAYYLVATRVNNGKVKNAVNAGVIGGILWSRLAAGGLSLTRQSLLSVSLVGTAYVTFVSLMKLKDSLS